MLDRVHFGSYRKISGPQATSGTTCGSSFGTSPSFNNTHTLCFQLAALSLNVDIFIEDISRPGYMAGFYSGIPIGQKAQNQILRPMLSTMLALSS